MTRRRRLLRTSAVESPVVLFHGLRMRAARWLLASVGFDLDILIRLSESAIYEEMIRLGWTRTGKCTMREWLGAERTRRLAAFESFRAHRRRLSRGKR